MNFSLQSNIQQKTPTNPERQNQRLFLKLDLPVRIKQPDKISLMRYCLIDWKEKPVWCLKNEGNEESEIKS